jgi:hypothetical protein
MKQLAIVFFNFDNLYAVSTVPEKQKLVTAWKSGGMFS